MYGAACGTRPARITGSFTRQPRPPMNLKTIDLNLLVYLDVLLRTGNVTQAAESIGISQPAMSNGLRRLRTLFADPLLIRTKDGMSPTERAMELQPLIRKIVADVEMAVQPDKGFDPSDGDRVFRISVSDYGECTLLPPLMRRLQAIFSSVSGISKGGGRIITAGLSRCSSADLLGRVTTRSSSSASSIAA